MADCKPLNTPLPSNALLVSYDSYALDKDWHYYQSLIGSLMYASLSTRPDISFAVTRLSCYAANPSSDHLDYAKWILHYLQGTKSFKIWYDRASNNGLVAYADADWGEDHDDQHSTSGQIFLLAGDAVTWSSRCQPTISHSSTEVEYKAASDSCRQMAWLRTFLMELGYNMNFRTPLYVNNQGAIFLSVNPAINHCTKHVKIHYHFIREFYEAGQVDIFYVSTNNMLADALTKNVPFSKVTHFCNGIGLIC